MSVHVFSLTTYIKCLVQALCCTGWDSQAGCGYMSSRGLQAREADLFFNSNVEITMLVSVKPLFKLKYHVLRRSKGKHVAWVFSRDIPTQSCCTVGIGVKGNLSLSSTVLQPSFLSQKPFGYVLLMGIRKIFSNHDIGRIFTAKVVFLKKESLGRATVYQIRPPIQWNSMAYPSLNAYFLFRLAPKEVVRQTVFHIQTATSSVMLGKSLNFCILSCKMVKIIPPLLWLNERIHIKHLAWYQKTQ